MSEDLENDLIRRLLERESPGPEAVGATLRRLVEAGADRVGASAQSASSSQVLGDHPGDAALAQYIDHTVLKPDATPEDVAWACEEAWRFQFAAVCVNPCYVPLAARWLAGSGVAVCSVAGFPLGASRPAIKAAEAQQAVEDGATEIDMVLAVGMLRSREFDYVESDIRSVVEAVAGQGVVVKVILETALLSIEEKIAGCLLARRAGADFVKTSTGFSSAGATVEDVKLMRRTVGETIGVKAAGGIRTSQSAKAMLSAGATRLGASASVGIVQGADGASKKRRSGSY